MRKPDDSSSGPGPRDERDERDEQDERGEQAEKGYGRPSKGKYSMDLGGYKTFGTEGQGDYSYGMKESNDTTCSPRVMLLTVTALEDTEVGDAQETEIKRRFLQESADESYMTFEVGNYNFLDDIPSSATHFKAGILASFAVMMALFTLV